MSNEGQNNMIKIKKSVGIMGVNCYILGDKNEAIIVDPGSNAESIIKTLNDEEIAAKYILLTHCHFDHIMAVESLIEKLSVKLVACQSEKENLLNSSVNYTDRYSRTPVELSADIYVKENDVITSGNYDFKVIETPGHTSGSMCLYCESEKLLVSGDTLFYTGVGRCDLATGNQAELVKSIKNKLFTLPEDVVVLPGHGDNTTIGFEKENNPFIF